MTGTVDVGAVTAPPFTVERQSRYPAAALVRSTQFPHTYLHVTRKNRARALLPTGSRHSLREDGDHVDILLTAEGVPACRPNAAKPVVSNRE